MKTLKKVAASFFLIIGLSIILRGTIDIINPNSTKDWKEGALVGVLILGLPSTAIGTWLIWKLYQEHQQRIKKLNLEKEQFFLRLLEEKEGTITVRNFALSAQISLEEAQKYLNEKAQQLNANYESTEEGGIIYKFPK